ncbi:YncE family protein [Actinoplanes sp. NPDC049599]|uniref:YncE family protein n=1 Tax=Actinoplanes sp. NPDC049599 TaxID=3363903 RepID=UPI00378BAE0D
MTTRRDLLIIAGGATLLGGCRDEPRPAAARAAPVPDVVVAETRQQGLVVLGGPHPRVLGQTAVTSADGRLAGALTLAGGRPGLQRLDPATGDLGGPAPIPAGWVPRVLTPGACALTRDAAGDRPAARDRTAILVLSGTATHEYVLSGVIEPDAFTQDATGLFVLEWFPAAAPERYRVRRLDLATGALHPLLTRDKSPVPAGAEEQMRGAGRQAVPAPGGQVLYTLYTHQPGHRHTRDLVAGRASGAHAFVHVLHLAEGWAYCLDLPEPFGAGPAAGHAVAVSADGRRLAVADATSGSVAYAGTETLAIDRVVKVPAAAGTAGLVFTPDRQRLLLGAGETVTTLAADGAVAARWPVPAAVRGIGISPDASRVYVGGADEVRWLDASTGAVRGRAPVGGLTALRHVR